MSSRAHTRDLDRAGSRRLSGLLSQATIALFIAVVAILLGGLSWATARSDQVSIGRQERVARHSIEIGLDALALQQETVAIWDETAQMMVAPKKDQVWLRYNVTAWLNRMFGHNEGFLFDRDDRPVQVAVEGQPVALTHYDRIRADVAPLLDSVRGRQHGRPGKHDRMPGQALARNSSVQTTARAIHDTHLMLVAGRPAIASAMLIKPSTDGFVGVQKSWPVLISIRYLDAGFMQELQSRYLIDSPHFSRSAATSAGESAIRLRTEYGSDLGYLLWKPELPGSQIMAALLPWDLLAVILLGAIMFLLMSRLSQALDERGALEERAARLAYHDALTGLPNRSLFADRLDEALKKSTEAAGAALLLIDLDRFKQVNDLLGHPAGDELIRQFAERLEQDCRQGDIVARLGGDEFALILSSVEHEDQVVERCKRTLALFDRPFNLMGHELFAGASIGAALASSEVIDGEELMRRADVAMYRAKGDGRNCARLFHAEMDAAAQQRNQLAGDMRRALDSSEFSLCAQPLVRRDRQVVGSEILLRWAHPTLGMVSPDEIIPLAEESGLIIPIGEWVLREALAIARSSPGQFTAVNLSPVQLRDEGFARWLVELCAAEQTDPRSIELEITEQTLLDDSSSINASLETLRVAGFRIALDDFGTGYFSLSYLRRFSVDKIKIDRSFVSAAVGSADTRAIIVAIITLGRALGLTIAAEGIETEEQESILLAAGVDELQGHLYARPRPVVAVGNPVSSEAASLTRRVA